MSDKMRPRVIGLIFLVIAVLAFAAGLTLRQTFFVEELLKFIRSSNNGGLPG
ncbi:MAG: hypothetical protein ACFFCD_12490 [Promethearchaeota archaeon]